MFNGTNLAIQAHSHDGACPWVKHSVEAVEISDPLLLTSTHRRYSMMLKNISEAI